MSIMNLLGTTFTGRSGAPKSRKKPVEDIDHHKENVQFLLINYARMTEFMSKLRFFIKISSEVFILN